MTSWIQIATGVALFALTGALAGCGTWIKYPDDYEPGDVATLDDFPDVDRCSHLTWGALLAEHTAEDGPYVLVDYDALAAEGESGYLLDQYTAMVNAIDPAALVDESERLAYWLNGYNANVVAGVVAGFGGDPGFSVLDSGTFFDDPVYGFGGTLLSLNQVEHGVLRGELEHPSVASADADTRAFLEAAHADVWGGEVVDARIHIALNCASLGCPNLPPFAYRPEQLDDQLAAMSMAFADNDAKGAGPDGISRIFEWFEPDFVADYGSVEAFVDAHRDGGAGDVDLDTYLAYDWSLNITD